MKPNLHIPILTLLPVLPDTNCQGSQKSKYSPGVGTLHMVESGRFVGFSLMHNDDLIHNALFAKQD